MQIQQIQAKEQIISIDDWQDYLRDGRQFLRTAERAHALGRTAFSNEALYNLTAMAIEKLIMAFLMKRGDLAENHTMGDLARALEKHLGPQPDMTAKLNYLDSFQEICDLEQARYVTPDNTQITTIITIGHEVADLILPLVDTGVST